MSVQRADYLLLLLAVLGCAMAHSDPLPDPEGPFEVTVLGDHRLTRAAEACANCYYFQWLRAGNVNATGKNTIENVAKSACSKASSASKFVSDLSYDLTRAMGYKTNSYVMTGRQSWAVYNSWWGNYVEGCYQSVMNFALYKAKQEAPVQPYQVEEDGERLVIGGSGDADQEEWIRMTQSEKREVDFLCCTTASVVQSSSVSSSTVNKILEAAKSACAQASSFQTFTRALNSKVESFMNQKVNVVAADTLSAAQYSKWLVILTLPGCVGRIAVFNG